MVEQIKGEYEAKEERHLTREFNEVEFVQVPRNQNILANKISKLASSEERGLSKNLKMEIQKHPSIEEVPTLAIQSTNS